LLADADSFLASVIPPGYIVEGSGGKGVPTLTPWVAVFDPAETKTAQRGMYIVYLFAEDMTTVALSLNQGVTEVVNRYRAEGKTRSAARQRLQAQAAAVRTALTEQDRAGWETSIDLHSRGPLQVDYEHGHLLGRTYQLPALPAEDELVADLLRLVAVYEDAIAMRDELRLTSADAIVTTTTARRTAPDDALLNFRPRPTPSTSLT
jgi:MrcB-like, N-terminal domain